MTASFHKEGDWVHKTRLTPSLCISLSISIYHKQEKRIGHKLSIQFRLIPHIRVSSKLLCNLVFAGCDG
jgi:hypothetical protein